MNVDKNQKQIKEEDSVDDSPRVQMKTRSAGQHMKSPDDTKTREVHDTPEGSQTMTVHHITPIKGAGLSENED